MNCKNDQLIVSLDGWGVFSTHSQTTLTDAPGFMRITLGVNETGIIKIYCN